MVKEFHFFFPLTRIYFLSKTGLRSIAELLCIFYLRSIKYTQGRQRFDRMAENKGETLINLRVRGVLLASALFRMHSLLTVHLTCFLNDIFL